MRSKSRIQFFEKQERKSSPLVPLQRGKDPRSQFIFRVLYLIFEKLEKLFFSRSFRFPLFRQAQHIVLKGDKGEWRIDSFLAFRF